MDGEVGLVNAPQLKGYIERVANLHDSRDELNADIRAVYAEAKEAGFDTTILREIVREFRTDSEARQSRYALLDQYRVALGMLAGTPLGDAAIERAETVERPKPFAEQPIRRRGRPRKNPEPESNGSGESGDPIADAMQRAQADRAATVSDFRQ